MLNSYCNWLFFRCFHHASRISIWNRLQNLMRIFSLFFTCLGGVCVSGTYIYTATSKRLLRNCHNMLLFWIHFFNEQWFGSSQEALTTPKIVVLQLQTAIGRKLLLCCKCELNVVTSLIHASQKRFLHFLSHYWHYEKVTYLFHLIVNKYLSVKLKLENIFPIPAVLLD